MKHCRLTFIIPALITVVIFVTIPVQAQTHIEIKTPMTPPNWALMERELLCANSRAIEEFYPVYYDERGCPEWEGSRCFECSCYF